MRTMLFLLALAAACVAPAYAAPAAPDRPKTLEELPCAAGEPVELRATGLPEPQVLTRVASEYPPSVAQVFGEAACGAMFDIDPAGVPVNIEVRCNVIQDGQRVRAPYWDTARERRFKTLFQNVGRHDIGCARYAPKDPARPNDWRANLYVSFDFAVNGQNGVIIQHAPGPFNRRGAPAITAEQAAYYAYKTRRLREDTVSRAGDAPKAIYHY